MTKSAALWRKPISLVLLPFMAISIIITAVMSWVVPTSTIPVFWNTGTHFELGPIHESWSLTQEIETAFSGNFGFTFFARPEDPSDGSPTLEIRLERAGQILWANRVHLNTPGMQQYTVEFPSPSRAGTYSVRIRVLKTANGAVVFRGVNGTGGHLVPYALNVMGLDQPEYLTLEFQVLRSQAPWRWFLERPPLPALGWIISFSIGGSIIVPLVMGLFSNVDRRISGMTSRSLLLCIVCALFPYLTTLPIIQGGGSMLADHLSLRTMVGTLAFPTTVCVAILVLGATWRRPVQAPGKHGRLVPIISDLMCFWLDGWCTLRLRFWRTSVRWWRATPILLLVASGVFLGTQHFQAADLLALTAIAILIPATIWPRGGTHSESG